MSRRRSSTRVLGAALLFACAPPEPPPTAEEATRRSPPAGEVIGTTGAYGSHQWLGLPYAQPPVGERRWRAPRALEPWSGAREALEHGPPCPQPSSPFAGVDVEPVGTPVGEEDCLVLDVYAPSTAPESGEAWPVMVWLHGGGNVVGLAGFYDGGRLAEENGVVVVVPQYRLGPLGWFAHAALRAGADGPYDASGNFGTLDQILALEWVRDNVAAFGGDPERVTVFGESAGGRDVMALLLSPPARGLFQRAISQSGGLRTLPPERAERLDGGAEPGHRNSSNEVLLRLLQDGGGGDRESARRQLDAMAPADVAALLRATPPPQLLAAYEREEWESLPDVPQLFRDGSVLPRGEPLALLADGDAADVPLMLGTTRDEFRIFLVPRPFYVEQLFGVLPRIVDEEIFLLTAEHVSNMWKATAVDLPATRLAPAQASPVFAYRFDWDEEEEVFFIDGATLVGASHGFDIPFVFGHWDLGPRVSMFFGDGNRAGREELSRVMRSYWTRFAATGDPGTGRAGDLPEWLPWSPRPTAPRVLLLDTAADGGPRMASLGASPAGVVLAVARDPRLGTTRRRCHVYRELAAFGRGFGPEDYAEVGEGLCADHPYEEWPWPEAAP